MASDLSDRPAVRLVLTITPLYLRITAAFQHRLPFWSFLAPALLCPKQSTENKRSKAVNTLTRSLAISISMTTLIACSPPSGNDDSLGFISRSNRSTVPVDRDVREQRDETDSSDDQSSDQDETTPSSGPAYVRVLFLATDDAIAAAAPIGFWIDKTDTRYIEDEIRDEIADANDILEAQDISHRFVVAGVVRTPKQEDETKVVGYLDWMKARLASADSNLLQQRNDYNADLIQMWIKESPKKGTCGWAFMPSPDHQTGVHQGFASQAVSWYERKCGKYTVVHELAHNLGAGHDRYVDKHNKAYDFGHGYTNHIHARYTIMAYKDDCKDHKGPFQNCQQLPRFSSPNQTYKGISLGLSSSHENVSNNVKVLKLAMPIAATFRYFPLPK